MNLPNKLTMLRILLVPFFVVFVYFEKYPVCQVLALVLFISASITDLLDGRIARSRNLVTDFGKFMDPLEDKILVLSAMLLFVEYGRFPAWAVILVVAREFAVTGLRLIAVEKGRVIAAARSGKIKTMLTMVGLCLMLLPVPPVVDLVCMIAIVVSTLWSGCEYFARNRDMLAR